MTNSKLHGIHYRFIKTASICLQQQKGFHKHRHKLADWTVSSQISKSLIFFTLYVATSLGTQLAQLYRSQSSKKFSELTAYRSLNSENVHTCNTFDLT